MPTAPLKPCRAPCCPALIKAGTYCEAHTRLDARTMYDATRRKDDPRLARNRAIRDSVPMRETAKSHKRANPICCDPFKDHNGWPVPTQHSHHIRPLLTHPELALDMGNLAALCVPCHNKVERMEQAKAGSSLGLFIKT